MLPVLDGKPCKLFKYFRILAYDDHMTTFDLVWLLPFLFQETPPLLVAFLIARMKSSCLLL